MAHTITRTDSPPMTSRRPQLNVRLDDKDMLAFKALQDRYGQSQAALITMLIRDRVVYLHKTEGFEVKRKLGGH